MGTLNKLSPCVMKPTTSIAIEERGWIVRRFLQGKETADSTGMKQPVLQHKTCNGGNTSRHSGRQHSKVRKGQGRINESRKSPQGSPAIAIKPHHLNVPRQIARCSSRAKRSLANGDKSKVKTLPARREVCSRIMKGILRQIPAEPEVRLVNHLRKKSGSGFQGSRMNGLLNQRAGRAVFEKEIRFV